MTKKETCVLFFFFCEVRRLNALCENLSCKRRKTKETNKQKEFWVKPL